MKWTTKDGIEIDIKDMKTSHLINTIRHIENMGNTVTRYGGIDCDGVYYDEEPNPIYLHMLKELKKRNNSKNK